GHLRSLAIEDSRQQPCIAPPRLPGSLGEVGELGQARAGLAPGAVRPVALLTVLPEQLAASPRRGCRRGRRPGSSTWLGLGRLGRLPGRRTLGQLAELLFQPIQFLQEALVALLETFPTRLFLFLLPALFSGWGEGPDVGHQAARLFLANLPAP